MARLRLALRTLFASPFVTGVAIVSLAFGIGANAAIFSLFNAILLRPLPVTDPGRLVNLSAPGPKPGSTSCNMAGSCEEVFSYPMFRDLERAQTVFSGVAAHRLFGANLAFRQQTISSEGVLVSGGYFPVLGVRPAVGRLLDSRDDKVTGESRVVVLSHSFWQRQFGGSPDVTSETLVVNGQTMTIVGVAPEGFDGTTFGPRPQVFVPITMRESMEPGFEGFANRRSYWTYLFARLKPGVSMEQASAALNGQYRAIVNDVEAPLQKGMSDRTLARFRTRQVLVTPGARGQSSVGREAGTPLTILIGITILVLVIACANIANLLLARGASRAGEMAVRLSLGAGRGQLVGQLLLEAGLLALFGGLAGLVTARWTLRLMASIMPAEAAAAVPIELDPTVLLFAGAVTIATALLFGLFPALHSTRPNLIVSLRGQTGQPSGARSAALFRYGLATGQIFLSMLLLATSGLFAKSLFQVSRVDLGLDADQVLTFGISPRLNGYSLDQSLQLFGRLEDELAAVPGVTRVTAGLVPLLAGSNWNSSLSVEGFPAGPDTDTDASFNVVGAGYFRALGVTLLAGREFAAADGKGQAKVAVVNEAFARKFNLGRTAVGKHMSTGGDKLDIEIVGLVRDAKYSDVKDAVPPTFVLPYRQSLPFGAMTFYVRTSLDPEQALAAMPKVVARLDPNLPVENLRTLPQQARENIFMDRFIAILSACFAGLATLLASVGLYGVLAYTLAQRTREIGLRMAVGASPARVRRMVLRQVAVMAVIGGSTGLAAAVGVGIVARSLLYKLNGYDPVVLVGAAVLLAAVTLGAGYIPARRASRLDPMGALRYE